MVSLEFQAPQIKAALAQVVRARRLELGLTQEALSFECGLATNSISRTECGEGNLTYFNLKRLTAGLQLPASQLLAYTEKIEEAETSAEPKSPAADPKQSAKAPADARRKSAKAPADARRKSAKAPAEPRKSVRERRQERDGESLEAAEKP